MAENLPMLQKAHAPLPIQKLQNSKNNPQNLKLKIPDARKIWFTLIITYQNKRCEKEHFLPTISNVFYFNKFDKLKFTAFENANEKNL